MKATEPRNIQVFNKIVLRVLAQLYESFPVPITLDPTEIGGAACSGMVEDDNEMFDLLMSTAPETISFLVEEGIIRYEAADRSLDSDCFPSARLTMQGLAILGRVPGCVDASANSRTIGSQLRAAADRGAADYAASLVGQIVGGSVAMAWRGFGG